MPEIGNFGICQSYMQDAGGYPILPVCRSGEIYVVTFGDMDIDTVVP